MNLLVDEEKREEKIRGKCYSMKTTEGQLTKCVQCIHRECISVEKCDCNILHKILPGDPSKIYPQASGNLCY